MWERPNHKTFFLFHLNQDTYLDAAKKTEPQNKKTVSFQMLWATNNSGKKKKIQM